MKQTLSILILLIITRFCFGQNDSISKHGFYIPKNIFECNQQLDKTFAKKAKNKLRQLDEKHITCDFGLCNISGIWITSEWFDNDSTRLANYLKQYSVTEWGERDYIIILAYKRYLNNKSFDIKVESEKLTHKSDSIKLIRNEKYKRDIIADSIDGIYIPTDIFSCFTQLDKCLNDTTKKHIKEKKNEMELSEFHFSLGLWMRNNWGLGGGSRLQQYFFNKKVMHPDDMSGIILVTYNKYLNGQSVDIDKIINEQKALGQEIMKNVVQDEPKQTSKIEDYYSKEYKDFLRTRKIKDFDIFDWSVWKNN